MSLTAVAGVVWTLLEPAAVENCRVADASHRLEACRGSFDCARLFEAEWHHAWCWDLLSPPRRRLPGEPEPNRAAGVRNLQLEITGAPEGPRRDLLEIVAAPAVMWEEVPEGLLPTWQLPPSGRLTIPHRSGETWRIRVRGPDLGSWWRELEPTLSATRLTVEPAPDTRLEVVDAHGRLVPSGRLLVLDLEPSGGAFLASYEIVDGRARIPGVPDRGPVALIASVAGFESVTVRGRLGALPQRIILREGRSLQGRFLDRKDQPIAGVAVRLEMWAGAAGESYVVRELVTGEDGGWELHGLPAGAGVLVARHEDHADYEWRGELGEADLDLGDLRLEPAVNLTVLVQDPEGIPIAGAEVRVGEIHRVATSRSGEAVVDHLPQGRRVVVEADAFGYVAALREITTGEVDEVSLSLSRAFTVRGTLVEWDGSPANGGRASLRRGATSTAHDLDASGAFHLELEPGVPCELILSSASSLRLTLELAAGMAGEERDLGVLRAPPGRRVSGRLLDADDGRPIVAARIWTLRTVGGDAVSNWLAGDVLSTTSDSEGRFELRGVEPSSGTVYVEAYGYAPLFRSFEGGVQDPDLGDFEMERGASVELAVEHPESEGAIARLDLGGRSFAAEMMQVSVHSGLAVFRNVPPGNHRASVVRGNDLLCEARVEVVTSGTDAVALCDGGLLRTYGYLRAGGEPAGGGTLLWMWAGNAFGSVIQHQLTPSGAERVRVTAGGPGPVEAEVAADGFFETWNLRPGPWNVVWMPHGGTATEPQEVAIPDADVFEAPLDFAGWPLAGVVVDTDGAPMSRAVVHELVSGSSVPASQDGSFRLLLHTSGKKYLRADAGGIVSPVVEARIGEGEVDGAVTLVVGAEEKESRILATVLAADGTPSVGAFVFAEDDTGRMELLSTDARGRISFSLHPPLPEQMRFAAYHQGLWALGPWSPRQRLEGGFEIRLSEQVGTLVVELAEPVERLSLFSTEGWDLAWLLRRTGIRIDRREEHRLVFDGAPAGDYRMLINGRLVPVHIEPHRATEITL